MESQGHDAIPGAIPRRVNLALTAALGAAETVRMFILPVLAWQDARWGLALVPLTLATPALWALLHEAFHGILHPLPPVNDACGRGLAVLYGSPFRLLRFGHLMHHRFNRTDLDRAEVFGDAVARRLPARLVYYGRLLGGLYLVELAASLALLIPRTRVAQAVGAAFGGTDAAGRTMRLAAERHLLSPGALAELRRDGLAVVLLHAAAFALYGALWWMLAAAILARAFLISFFDNAYHYGTALGDVLNGHNLRLPRPVAAAMLNFNLHAVHHRHPALPWTALPAAFAESNGTFEGGYASVALRQLAGPLPESRLAPGRS